MSKILIITNHSYMLYRFRLELIQELMKSHEVVLSMPFVGHEDDFKAMGLRCIEIDVDRRGINPIKDLKLMIDYYRLISKEKPDLVITYSIKPNIYAGLICSWLNVEYCVNIQGLGTAFQSKKLAKFVSFLYKKALRKAKTVFFENYGNQQEFINRNIIELDRTRVLNGAGINMDVYSLMDYPEHDVFHFLYLGRIMKEKGMDELFEAIEMLVEDGFDVVLDLVGFFEDEYKEKVEELQAQGIVIYHGFQEDPIPYYANADCVVLPSYHEGLSNVLLEAGAIGRPLITTDIFGCKETVLRNKTGFLCEVKNTKSLYVAMKQMLKLSKEERRFMGEVSHRFIKEKFEKSIVVEKTLKGLF